MKHLNILFIIVSLFFISCSASKRVTQNTKHKTETTIAKTEPIVKKIETPKEEEEPQEEIILETVNKEIEKNPKENIKEPIKKVTESIELFNHVSWNNLIYQNVASNGDVNYKGFKNNWGVLREYIKTLGEQLPEDAWSKEEKLAYWMNAYNAMTIDLILRNYPLTSIKDIKDPWDQRLWKLGTKWYNLNEIEHQILRKMGDPRIHFGINCASFSCPPLLNEAFTSTKVNEQLDRLAVRFINDPERNTITPNKIKVSKIFSWFSKDFKQDGNLISFLNKYAKTPISPKAKRSFADYNWNLNEQ
ncbi:DUF547 domain-containing protein [Flavobacteriaceae bacterium AU392]|nr:DUF547 domain-containing protein [Flavobacteriaceae bacterium]RKM84121.1 DUF547 domain-containing protein [Flavobacteriaceae bacterium AU392]